MIRLLSVLAGSYGFHRSADRLNTRCNAPWLDMLPSHRRSNTQSFRACFKDILRSPAFFFMSSIVTHGGDIFPVPLKGDIIAVRSQ